MSPDFQRGLQEVGDGLYAYLQPDGGWGWSNAGLVADGERTLLIDTLFDLRLTERMLSEMRRAVPAAARIDTLVNTHANGDHTYGNQLVGDARIVASRRTAEEMPELPAADDGRAASERAEPRRGRRVLRAHLRHVRLQRHRDDAADRDVRGRARAAGGRQELRLIEVGPAHTRGDTLVLAPAQRVLFTGDILFHGMHPLAWAGPISNWTAACERILEMDVDVIVPGHGALADKHAIRELKDYFDYLGEQARRCHADGMAPLDAARTIALDRWSAWAEPERLVVNIATLYRELEDDPEPLNNLEIFQQMAALAGER